MSGGAYPGWNSMVEGIPFSGRNLPPKMMLNWKAISFPMNFNVYTSVIFQQPVDFARNQMCEGAIANGSKYIAFWDEDVLRPPQSIRELVYRMEHTPDAAVIGGVVCLKAEPAEPMLFRSIGGGPYWDWRVGEFFEVSGIGMGNTIVRVEALKDIERPWFKTVNDYAQLMEGVPATEQWTEDLFFCFPPGQIVYGDMNPIESCSVGSLVVTDKGRRKQVSNTIQRQYDGEIVEILPKYGGEFSATGNHPILIGTEDGTTKYVPADKIRKGDRLIVPIPTRIREDRTDFLPSWNLIRNKHIEIANGKYRYVRTHEKSHWFPLKVNVTEDLCSLIGYWVAEGSVSGSPTSDSCTLNFTFSKQEMNYAQDVSNLIERCFEMKSIIQERDHSLNVLVSSVSLCDFFNHYFGRGASNKHLPEEILFASRSCIAAFLRSYWRGDGNKGKSKNNDLALTTVSEKLVHDLRCLLIRMGMYPIVHKAKVSKLGKHSPYRIDVCRKYYNEWTDVIGIKPIKRNRICDMSGVKRVGFKPAIGGGWFSVMVEDIQKSNYSGPVYNLSVESDHTYNINGFAVHNCDKVKKTKKWKIYCDGSLLCAHVDLASGKEYGLPPDSKPLRHLLVPTGTKKILDVGSGANPYKTNEGPVVTFDLDEECKPDYRGDCRRLPFGTGAYDIVHSRHLLEQFPPDQQDDVLKEMARVLKPKGELRLTVANLEWAADQIKAGKVDGPVLAMLYGDNRKSAFTPRLLQEKLKEHGLPKVQFKLEGSEIHVAARSKSGRMA